MLKRFLDNFLSVIILFCLIGMLAVCFFTLDSIKSKIDDHFLMMDEAAKRWDAYMLEIDDHQSEMDRFQRQWYLEEHNGGRP